MKKKSAYRISELAKAGPLGRSSLYKAMKDERPRLRLTAQKYGRSTIVTDENWLSFLRNLPVVVPRAKRSAPRE